MPGLDVGEQAPDFCLKDKDGREVCLRDFRGKWVVLYFYPKDNTSGCTREALDFTAKLEDFDKLGAVVIGVSKDSIESHRVFAERHNLKVLLLSDPNHKVIEAYGAWAMKKRYGREYFGTIRSTFLIGPDGTVRKVWRNVRVKGHVDSVLETLKSMVEG